jgi:hypothetical protein
MELAFEWESVNQSVPETHFTAAAIGLPPETQIVSFELGTRVALGTLRGEESAEQMPTAFSQRDRSKTVTVIICSVMLAILIIVCVTRRRRRRQAGD